MFHQYNRKLQLGSWLTILVWLYGFISVVSAQTLADPNLRVAELMSGLSQPTGMAFIGSDDLLVLQKMTGEFGGSLTVCFNRVPSWMCTLIMHPSAGCWALRSIRISPEQTSSICITPRAALPRIRRVPLSPTGSIVMAGTEALCSIRSLFSTFDPWAES
jgi:hypothetical protein